MKFKGSDKVKAGELLDALKKEGIEASLTKK